MVQTHSCGLSAARRLDAAVSSAAETEVANGGAGESGRYSNARNGVKDAANAAAECGGILRTNTFVELPARKASGREVSQRTPCCSNTGWRWRTERRCQSWVHLTLL